jgi:hypothetical protein
MDGGCSSSVSNGERMRKAVWLDSPSSAQQVVLVTVSYLALIHWRQNEDVLKALYQLWVNCSRCVAGKVKFNHRMLGASAKACVASVVGWI